MSMTGLWRRVSRRADPFWVRLRARGVVSPPTSRVVRKISSGSVDDRDTVHLYVASLNTATATELCIRSMREFAGYPFELTIGDSGSDDGSVEMLRRLETLGWLSVEVAAGGRLHAEWLDEWRGSCTARLAVFVDSDVEFLRPGWLVQLVSAWRSTGRHLFAASSCLGLGDSSSRLEERPSAPRHARRRGFLVDVDQARSIRSSFAFDQE